MGAAGTAVVLLAVWCNLPMNKLKGNEQKLAQILAYDDWYSRVAACRLKVPEFAANVLLLNWAKDGLARKAALKTQELVAAGYLVRTNVAVTNLPAGLVNEESRLREVFRRLQKGIANDVFFLLSASAKGVDLTCPTNELFRIQQAMNQP